MPIFADKSENASCVTLNEAEAGLWYDEYCTVEHRAVCEKPHGSETRPPTVATPPSGTCASGWEEFGDYCYLVSNSCLSVFRACTYMYMHLQHLFFSVSLVYCCWC